MSLISYPEKCLPSQGNNFMISGPQNILLFGRNVYFQIKDELNMSMFSLISENVQPAKSHKQHSE